MASAQNFTVNLDRAQEVPVPGASSGTGSGTLTLNADNTVTYNITFVNLSSGINNAHIHGPSAPPGTPAGVLVPLSFVAGQTAGTLSGTTAALTGTGLSSFLAGNTYVNIHTVNNPGGEIRGQILAVVPEPSTMSLGLLGLGSLLVWMRRRSA